MNDQLSFLPEPPFCPLLPPHGSVAEQALYDLVVRDVTQPDWLREGKGWRLAAAVKELDYLGWEPISIRVHCDGRRRAIARYSLSAKAKQVFYTMRQQGGGQCLTAIRPPAPVKHFFLSLLTCRVTNG